MDKLSLYTDPKLASLYSIIADDRDFYAECEIIAKMYAKYSNKYSFSKKILELFAGPAYHASCFKKYNDFDYVYAIDSAEAMKDIAVEKYDITPNMYRVGMIPETLDDFDAKGSIDIALIMRYSLGLLDYKYYGLLFEKLASTLATDGVVIIELHKSILFENNFNKLDIRERIKLIPESDNSVTCKWPAGEIQHTDDRNTVIMPVEIKMLDGKNNIINSYSTYSKEYLCSADELIQMVTRSKLFTAHLLSSEELEDNFNQSDLLLLKKS